MFLISSSAAKGAKATGRGGGAKTSTPAMETEESALAFLAPEETGEWCRFLYKKKKKKKLSPSASPSPFLLSPETLFRRQAKVSLLLRVSRVVPARQAPVSSRAF